MAEGRGRFDSLDGLILAADTVGWLHGKVVGKPEDEADAAGVVESLSGTVHELWTSVLRSTGTGDSPGRNKSWCG